MITPRHQHFFKDQDKNIGFGFFTDHKITSNNTFPFTLNHNLLTIPYIYNYSLLSNNYSTQINVTHCSIAACKSIGHAPTNNKVYQVLFDSGSSKPLIDKHIVPQNFIPISSNNDLWIFLLAGATASTALMALEKIRFPEFNHNIIVNKHPTLIVDSMSLCYDIFFGADFLDKCSITLDYESHKVQSMEYTIPLQDTLDFFPIAIALLYSHHLNLNLKTTKLVTHLPTPLQLASLMLNMNRLVSMMLLSTNITFCLISNMFNILSKHKKLFDGSLGVYPHNKVHIKPVHHCTYPVPHKH